MSAETPAGPQMDRRTMLKTVGAGAGALAVGSGAVPTHQLSLTQDADAIGFVGGLLIGGAAAATGAYVAEWTANDEDVDTSNVSLEDAIYNAAEVQADTRKTWKDTSKAEFQDRNDSQYAELAWTEIRLGTAEARANGLSVSEAKSQAREALQEQTTRSLVNVVERWNTGVIALQEQIQADINNGVGVFHSRNGDRTNMRLSDSDGTNTDLSPVDPANESGDYTIWESSMDLPVPAAQVRDSDEPLTCYAISVQEDKDNASYWYWNCPLYDGGRDSDTEIWGADSSYDDYNNNSLGVSDDLSIRHSSYSTKTVLDGQLFFDILNKIRNEYNTIDSDLGTYVENLYDAFSQTDLDPADIIGPRDLYQQFADGNTQQRINAELIAAGAAPRGGGYQVEISHPDLQADSLWCTLWPRFDDGVDNVNITGGTTLSASDYVVAYIGYVAKDTNRYTTTTLSGSEDLQILASSDSNPDLSQQRNTTADSTNGVQIWDSEQHGEAPETLRYPGDFDGKELVINGAENQSTHPLTDVQQNDDGTISVPGTDLNAGEAVEGIRIRDRPTYSQPGYVTSDPTTVDKSQVEEQIQDYSDLQKFIDEVEEQNNSGGGAGFWPSGWEFPSLPGFGTIETIVLAVAGIFGLSILSNLTE